MSGGLPMDIAALSMSMSQVKILTEVSTAVLAQSLDAQEQTKDAVKMMMEQSVNPHLGTNIDLTI